MSGYILSDISELVEFDNACYQLALGCPQYRVYTHGFLSDPQRQLASVDGDVLALATSVFKHWVSHEVLWDKGYYKHNNSSKLDDTFERYFISPITGELIDVESVKFKPKKVVKRH